MARNPLVAGQDYDIVASQPVLSSHGEATYPLAVTVVDNGETAVDLHNEEVPEPYWAQWKRVDQSVGGMTGAQDRLGYRTGMRAHSARSYGFTGRMLVAPRDLTHPQVGNVGLDGRADRLNAGVNAQNTDFVSNAQDIARSFLAARGVRGAQSTVNDGLV